MIKDFFINGNGGWLGAVARLGLSVVLSLGLTAFLVFRVDAALGSVLTQVHATNQKMDIATTNMNTFADRQEASQRALRNIALQTCINVAKTETAQQACLRAAEQ